LEIKKITVIGAGTMGHGIAHVACLGGYETVLQDISEEMLGRAKETVRKNLNKAAERNLITKDEADAAVSRLSTISDLEGAVRDADFVIEAIPEIIEAKVELYTRIDKACKADAYFASNTSSLSVTEMAAVTERPERFVGMHFFNPVHKMKLVESCGDWKRARRPSA
jgi:enoyl-CoA hydratase/3-hydroxyacyl-CoA dehydrogenase